MAMLTIQLTPWALLNLTPETVLSTDTNSSSHVPPPKNCSIPTTSTGLELAPCISGRVKLGGRLQIGLGQVGALQRLALQLTLDLCDTPPGGSL